MSAGRIIRTGIALPGDSILGAFSSVRKPTGALRNARRITSRELSPIGNVRRTAISRTDADGDIMVSTIQNYGTAKQRLGEVLVHGDLEVRGEVKAPILGSQQTWEEVTAIREIGVVYTNTTGAPIEVAIVTAGTTSEFFYVDGQRVGRNSVTSTYVTINVTVPNGSTYELRNTTTLTVWSELRKH